MKKKIVTALCLLLTAGSLTLYGRADGVASLDEMAAPEEVVTDDMTAVYAEDLKEGTYSIEVLSSSSMFKIIDCQLTVEDGTMTAVMTMKGDGYLKLFMGTGLEALEASEEEYIPFVLDEDGRQTYEVPVEALDYGISCAAYSKNREKWYDRTLVFSASDVPQSAFQEGLILTPEELGLEPGTYTVEGSLEGGSGKTAVESPLTMEVTEEGITTVLIFNSSNYSYVLVEGEKYEQSNMEGNSTFEIPVTAFDWNIPIKANSTAMGLNHEIDYTLFLDSSTVQKVEGTETSADKTDTSADKTAALTDGTYVPDQFSWSGGTGKVDITCDQITLKDGKAYARLTFSSDSYAYVKVDGVEYTGTSENGCTVFEIPVELNVNNEIQGMTTKMSAAHEITYTIFPGLGDLKKSGEDAPEITGLSWESETVLEYAEHVRIFQYEQGITLLEVSPENKEEQLYLVVPEDAELPAGVEKEATVICLPVEHYIKMKEAEADLQEIVRSHCDLAVISGALLEDTEAYEELVSNLETLGIPAFLDCREQENSEEAREEWNQVYAVLLGQEPEGTDGTEPETESAELESAKTESAELENAEAPELSGLSFQQQLSLDFAEGFEVYFYEGGYALIHIADSGEFLVVPEGAEVPGDLREEVTVLQQPLDQIYLAATSAMSLFGALDSLEHVRLSGTQAEDWYVAEASEAMERGEILFAGKYSEPDYELLLDEGCDLAIESTMILHTPKVKEMLEMLGIPVLMERASYETHPLGRTEWIKLYGVLLGKVEEAEVFFEEQKKVLEEMQDFENTEKTIAFFYLSTDGTVVVRNVSDYIPSMIELAGGRYVWSDSWNVREGSSSVELTMEEFYAAARDADYLVYNSTIAGELNSVEALLAESTLFADFQAVQEGKVWTTDLSMFQATDTIGQLIYDFHRILTGEQTDTMTFLKKVD